MNGLCGMISVDEEPSSGSGDDFGDSNYGMPIGGIIKSDPELHAKWLEQYPDMPL